MEHRCILLERGVARDHSCKCGLEDSVKNSVENFPAMLYPVILVRSARMILIHHLVLVRMVCALFQLTSSLLISLPEPHSPIELMGNLRISNRQSHLCSVDSAKNSAQDLRKAKSLS